MMNYFDCMTKEMEKHETCNVNIQAERNEMNRDEMESMGSTM